VNVKERNKKTNPKTIQIAGKGQNVTFEISNPLQLTKAATEPVDGHVPENRGEHVNILLQCTGRCPTDLLDKDHLRRRSQIR
jgi:hypothetical protein